MKLPKQRHEKHLRCRVSSVVEAAGPSFVLCGGAHSQKHHRVGGSRWMVGECGANSARGPECLWRKSSRLLLPYHLHM